jgi:phosphatidylglycerophosphatase A
MMSAQAGSAYKDFWIKCIASACGAGYAPIVPGTFGTLAAVPLYYLIAIYGNRWILGLAAIICLGIGIWVSDRAEILYGKKDPSQVVIDEVMGYLVAMLFLPFQVKYVLISFVVFRIMDIVKPWPARQIQVLHGGWGIMFDDLVAGIYSGLVILSGDYLYRIIV